MATGFNVNTFRNALVADGARPNLFEVNMTFPGFLNANGKDAYDLRFMCKSAQLPASTVGVIEVPYFGRQVKIAGNRTYAEWTVNIINDETFNLRNAFERWHSYLNGAESNKRSTRAATTNQYGGQAIVRQYAKAGHEIKNYTIVGMFPSDVAAIELDWGTNDTIEEFQVTFAYQYWIDNRESKGTPIPTTNADTAATGTTPSGDGANDVGPPNPNR
jgi:hypothetical protein